MTLYRLSTVGGERYILSETRGSWSLRAGHLTIVRPSLASALFTLGGMVEWYVWDDNTRLILSWLNGGRGAI